MKINIQKCVRVIAPIVSVLAVVFLCALPASAAVYDYNDLVTNVVVDGDNDLVTVSVPVDNNRFNIRDLTAGTRNILFGNNVSHSVVADHTYIFEISPGYSDRVLLDGIPEGTLLKYTVDIGKTSWGYIDVGQMSYSSDIYYLDSNGSFVSSTHKEYLLEETPTYVFLAPLENIPSNAASFATFLNLRNFSFVESRTISLTVVSCEFQMSISSLYRLQQQTGKTNTLLKEVEQKLADQGKTLDGVLQQQQQTNDKLDDIINGSSEQQNAADKFKDDIGNASNSLDSAGDALNQVPKPTISVGTLIPNDVLAGNDYLVYVASIQEFWKSEILSAVTLVLGGMILISYVLFGEKG